MGKVLGLITARAGSKGLAEKNVRPLAGRPLIAWTADAARAATQPAGGAARLDRVVVSTDSQHIADVCRNLGAEAPFLRPADLARDDSPHIDVALHALDWLRRHESYVPDWLMLLQPTSPLRTAEDIAAAIALAESRGAPAAVGIYPTHAHPFLSRTMSADGSLAPFVPCPLAYPRRQDLPPAYALNGAIYLTRRDVLVHQKTFEPPGTIGYLMPPDRSLQIDDAWDLHLVELVLRDRCGAGQSQVQTSPSPGSAAAPRRISEK